MQGYIQRTLMPLLAACVLAIGVAPLSAWAAEQAGFVLVATGGVTATGADGATRQLQRRSPVFAGDRLRTTSTGRAQVKFTDGSLVAIKPGSELRIDAYSYGGASGDQKSLMSLLKGGFRTMTGAIGKTNREDYRVTTPVATIGIRGTLYETWYEEGAGLSLGVWDGGISACNASGCLDLGQGADYRFGFVPANGKARGTDEAPEGIGEDVAGDDGAGEDGEAGDEAGFGEEGTGENALDSLESDLVDEDIIPEFIVEDVLPRSEYPLTGYSVVSNAQGANPWGGASLLRNEYGRVVVDLVSNPVTATQDWALWSSTAGWNFLLPGAYCDGLCQPALPQVSYIGRSGTTRLMWGAWSGMNMTVSAEDLVLDPLTVTVDNPVMNPGLYVMGDYASPAVVASTVGKASFDLMMDPSTSLPMLQVQNMVGMSLFSASGSMTADLSTGKVVGSLVFDDIYYNYWKVLYKGSVSAYGMDLQVQTDNTTPNNASHYMPFNGIIGTDDQALSGSIAATFIGGTEVDGVVGGFDLVTQNGAGDVQGVFVLGTRYPMQGYAVTNSLQGANEWGSATFFDIDWGFATIDTAVSISPAARKWLFVADDDATGVTRTFTPYDGCGEGCVAPDGSAMLLGATGETRVAWGYWAGAFNSDDLVTGTDFTDPASGTPSINPGVWVMGDYAAPEVIASMTGTSYFMLASNPTTFAPSLLVQEGSVAYTPDYLSNPAGSLVVDFDTGAASGNLYFTNPNLDQWTLAYDGSVSSAGLALAITTDTGTPTNGSYFSTAGVDLAVQGTIEASFVGMTAIDGVVGAFDVNTVDSTDTNAAQGVFVMTPTLP